MTEPIWTEVEPGISVWHAPNAHDFLTALRRSNDSWWEGDRFPWAFRGHQDADWPLLPSAWRPGNKVIAGARAEATKRFQRTNPTQRLDWAFGNHHSGPTRFGSDDSDLQRRLTIETTAELLPVYDFLLACDRLGLATPISQLPPELALSPDWLMGAGSPLVGDDFFRFSDIPNYISLAQHHGIPTRLLDWTHDPVKAAFFAAEGAGADKAPTDIAVWAIHRQRAMSVKGRPAVFPVIFDGKVEDNNNYDEIHPTIEIVRTPMRENFFLAAQSGQFTSIRGSGIDYMVRAGRRPSLETFVAESGVKETVLQKIILGKSNVPELARMLAREEISRSRLMPTHDNVAADVTRSWESVD